MFLWSYTKRTFCHNHWQTLAMFQDISDEIRIRYVFIITYLSYFRVIFLGSVGRRVSLTPRLSWRLHHSLHKLHGERPCKSFFILKISPLPRVKGIFRTWYVYKTSGSWVMNRKFYQTQNNRNNEDWLKKRTSRATKITTVYAVLRCLLGKL